MLEKRGASFDLYVTKSVADASEHACDAARDYESIVVVGGDGTMNTVINGIMRNETIPSVGIIPCGRGNDFARSLGIPLGIEGAVETILKGRIRSVDLASANDRYFVEMAGIGFTAESMINFPRIPLLPAFLLVNIGIVRTLLQHQNLNMTIRPEGMELSGKFFDVSVANGKFIGAGSKFAPDAVIDDGLLDVVIIGDITLLEAISNANRVKKGLHLSHPKVRWTRVKKVEVETDALYHVDGEVVGKGPLKAEIAGSINVIA